MWLILNTRDWFLSVIVTTIDVMAHLNLRLKAFRFSKFTNENFYKIVVLGNIIIPLLSACSMLLFYLFIYLIYLFIYLFIYNLVIAQQDINLVH